MSLAQALAEQIHPIRDLGIPDQRAAEWHLVDSLASLIFGRRFSHPLALLDDLPESPNGCSVLLTGRRVSPTDASFLNAWMAGASSLEAGGAYVQPGPCVVPAVLAASQVLQRELSTRIAGIDLLRWLGIGYEVTVRLSEWVGFLPERYVGWHTPGFHGAIGASAASAIALGLEPEQLAHAIALAADMAGGGLIHARNFSKGLHPSKAAQAGIQAALLARHGIEGELDILEHARWGYRRALTYSGQHAGRIPQPPIDQVYQGLGERYTAWSRLKFKRYPCHALGASIIDTCRALIREASIESSGIEHITIGISSFMAEHENMLMAALDKSRVNFSLPYAAAIAVCVDPLPLTSAGGSADLFFRALDSPEVNRVQQLVRFEVSDDIDRVNEYSMDCDVTIAASGKEFSHRWSSAEEHHPPETRADSLGSFTRSELCQKFRNLATPIVGTNVAEELLGGIEAMATAPDVWQTLRSLEGGPAGTHTE